MDIITDIFEAVGDAITAFAGAIGNGFAGIINIFYNETGLTTLGTLGLIGVGVGIVYWAFRMVRGLMRVRG